MSASHDDDAHSLTSLPTLAAADGAHVVVVVGGGPASHVTKDAGGQQRAARRVLAEWAAGTSGQPYGEGWLCLPCGRPWHPQARVGGMGVACSSRVSRDGPRRRWRGVGDGGRNARTVAGKCHLRNRGWGPALAARGGGEESSAEASWDGGRWGWLAGLLAHWPGRRGARQQQQRHVSWRHGGGGCGAARAEYSRWGWHGRRSLL